MIAGYAVILSPVPVPVNIDIVRIPVLLSRLQC